jgi:hypothetical protein
MTNKKSIIIDEEIENTKSSALNPLRNYYDDESNHI